jgi:flagellar motor switch protein FliG
MHLKQNKKNNQPFALLFQYLTPKEFLFSFQAEYIQTMAFILSFAPTKKYAKQVIDLVNDENAREFISSYLNNHGKKILFSGDSARYTVEAEFIEQIEKTALGFIRRV